jgi:hypothetical protein
MAYHQGRLLTKSILVANQLYLASVPSAVVYTSSILALADTSSPTSTHVRVSFLAMQTLNNLLHFDLHSHYVNFAQHTRCDKGMNVFPIFHQTPA